MHTWSLRLNDATMSISVLVIFKHIGGSSAFLSFDLEGGKVGFSDGELDVLYVVADSAPSCCRALKWGSENSHTFSNMLSVDTLGSKVASMEDVFQLLEKVEFFQGGGVPQATYYGDVNFSRVFNDGLKQHW